MTYHPVFQRSAKLVRHLAETTSVNMWIQQQLVDVSWVASTQREALIRLAHFSTRIEGNPLTLPEVEALAAGQVVHVADRAKQEVLNYFSALRWIWQKSPPTGFQESHLLKLHVLLTKGLLPLAEVGTYKTKPNAVFGGGKIIYRPPPPEIAPQLTKALLVWINGSSARAEHPIVAAAVAHHRLVSIHPFMDGNGRITRALESWMLYRRGFDTHHIFALDEFFESDRARYYREIQIVREQGEDLTGWLEYISEAVLATLRKTQARIQSLKIKKPRMKIVLNAQQERIMQTLQHVSRIRGGELARALHLSRAHLSKLLAPLVKSGLVVKEGSTKAASYRME